MLLPKQVWKDIPGYEGKYQVNQIGQVRSLNYRRTGKVKRLSPSSTIDGYLTVGLWKEGKSHRYRVNRLVAEAFISNPSNYPQVMHLDGNPANNHISNLAWGTAKMNNSEPIRIERVSKPVIMLSKNNEPLAVFKSQTEASQYLGRDKSNISHCLGGRITQAYDYKWKRIKIIIL